jgi:hypothetical protein
MARKSLELRLGQTKKLIDEYESAGLESDRGCRFMRDMMYRMERGKGMSTGQRRFLDDLIDQGVPTPKNESRVKEILAAADVDGMQQVAQTLKDFAFKVGKGWNLSEKQEKFLTNLLAKAETLKVEGRFRPSDNAVEDLENAVEICVTKNNWYWQHRPGTSKAYEKISQWLDWNRRNKVSEDLRAKGIDEEVINLGHTVGEEPIIDQWSCDKLLKAVKNQISELKNPKHPQGAMVWKRVYNGPNLCALIAGDPELNKGDVVYPCLVNSVMMMVPTKDLLKRRG